MEEVSQTDAQIARGKCLFHVGRNCQWQLGLRFLFATRRVWLGSKRGNATWFVSGLVRRSLRFLVGLRFGFFGMGTGCLLQSARIFTSNCTSADSPGPVVHGNTEKSL